ncbi:alpha/beta-hydrolase [Apiospora phragmitis]|uniref:Alpha/beta-hydrolase n=1 Tax=Apiospora phragmitis TaxID=2905665 RepID=A0ABR1VXI7_9PEZI
MHYFSLAVPFWVLVGIATASKSYKATEQCPVADVSALVNTGDPVGKTEVFENVTMYYTGNENSTATGTAVLFLTDIYGLTSPENKRLADAFGRAGYFTVAPDLFDGAPSPLHMNAPGFNQTRFLEAHGPDVADPLVAKGVRYLRDVCGARRVAVAGYCYGGGLVDAAFAAHPSGWTDEEIGAIARPASVAQGQNDELNPAAKRRRMEDLLASNATGPWQVDLYGGAMHGFGVRANVSDPQQRFAMETAFIQAVRWFEFWAK